MKELLAEAHARSVRYLESLSIRPVQPGDDAVARLSELSVPLPEDPVPPQEVLSRLDELGSPATIANAGSRGTSVSSPEAFCLSASPPTGSRARGTRTRTSSWAHRPQRRWRTSLCLGSATFSTSPIRREAGSVTGTAMGNFSGLVAERHAVLKRSGWDVEANGLFGAPEVQVVVGEEAHTTLFQALALAGFGRERVTKVPVDDQGRMKADAIPKLSGPSIVCLQAGNVNSGSFDRIDKIGTEIARDHDTWVHVDGAFGLWAKASPTHAHLVDGIANVDSIATDLHKWLNVPYDAGLALYRFPDAARNALSTTAAYLPEGDERQPCDYTCWCSGTTWKGRTAMRISVSSWATTEDNVEQSLAAIIRVATQ